MRLRLGSYRLVAALMRADLWLTHHFPNWHRAYVSMSVMAGYGLDPHLFGDARRNVDNYYLIWTGEDPLDEPDENCIPLPGEFPQLIDAWRCASNSITGTDSTTIHASIKMGATA